MDKEKQNVIAEKAGMHITEILLFALFIVLGVVVCVLGYESWLGLLLLGVGLLSLFLNDFNKWLDLFIALVWSGLYAYFSYANGLIVQAVMVSLAYLIVKVISIFVSKKTNAIVNEKKSLKLGQFVSGLISGILVIVGSYFLARISPVAVLPLFDSIAAVMLVISLIAQLIKVKQYFIIRLVSMILIIILWVIRGVIIGFETGTASAALMFMAFIIFDNVRLSRYSTAKILPESNGQAKDDIFDSPEFKEAQKKYEKENPAGLPGRSVGIDKDDKRDKMA